MAKSLARAVICANLLPQRRPAQFLRNIVAMIVGDKVVLLEPI